MPKRRDRYGDLSDLSLRFARQRDFGASEACGLRALLLPRIGRGHSFHSDGASLTGFGADKSDQLRSTGTGEVKCYRGKLGSSESRVGLWFGHVPDGFRMENSEFRKEKELPPH